MSRVTENTGFICAHCGRQVQPLDNGSYRNHCPFCLYSLHVDEFPGDRRASCGGLMAPIAARYHSKKGYQIVHRCLKCNAVQVNIAARAAAQPDDLEALLKLPLE